MAALTQIVDEIVSGVFGGFLIFQFYVGIVDGSC
jgi:hypothetical protein